MHARSLGVATQALLLLFQLMSSRSTVSDRFYRCVLQIWLPMLSTCPLLVACHLLGRAGPLLAAGACQAVWLCSRKSCLLALLLTPPCSVTCRCHLQGAVRGNGQPGAVPLHQGAHVPQPAVQGALILRLCLLHAC